MEKTMGKKVLKVRDKLMNKRRAMERKEMIIERAIP
jgi:hypothetical protein